MNILEIFDTINKINQNKNMKGTFKIIELEDYDVLIQKHWSQDDEEVEKYGDYQLIMSFWLGKMLCKVIMGYDNESLMIEDYDNSSKEKVNKLINNMISYGKANEITDK